MIKIDLSLEIQPIVNNQYLESNPGYNWGQFSSA